MPVLRATALSIKAQLVLAIVMATVVASLVAAGLSIWREVDSYAQTKRAEGRALAGLFATAAADGVARRDSDATQVVLGGMRGMPNVLYVRIADASNETLAEHGFAVRLVEEKDAAAPMSFSVLAAGHPIAVRETVVRAGRPVGTVELLISTHDLSARLSDLATNGAAALSLSLVLGVLAAQGFRRRIMHRINSVVAAMRRVETTHGYDTKIAAGPRDEFAPLVESFNAMMSEIGSRDFALAEHRANLESVVLSRTSDLNKAKQAAEEANSAKSQFLATMSHEIRTPLNGLLVMAELLAAAELQNREKRYADVIVRSGGTLLAIINDILDFSKIEAGKIEIEAIPIELADVVDDVCQLFATKAASQGLDLAAYVDPALAAFEGDPVRLGQIIGNLVNNAIKFTAAGHVIVEAAADAERPGHVHFSVSDTGIGIAADKVDTVFESFSQADQSITRRFGGTGLGLSISQRLVRAMGGVIGVESRMGEGSRFWFSLPLRAIAGDGCPALPGFGMAGVPGATASVLARYGAASGGEAQPLILDPRAAGLDQAALRGASSRIVVLSRIGDSAAENWLAEGRAAAALPWPVRRRELVKTLCDVAAGRVEAGIARPKALELATYSGARVLVVDDNPVNREVATEALRRFGIAPDTAVDGEDARRRADGGGYDLILMDASMPVLDGFGASRAIRADEKRARVARQPIVALTAHAMSEAGEWRAADMDGLLLKPFSLAQLAACLSAHLPADLRRSGGVAPAADDASQEQLLEPATMAMLDVMASSDAAAVRRIVEIFIAQAAPALLRLEAEAAQSEPVEVAAAAHAFKSMALSVGAKALAGALAVVEAAARSGSPEEARHAMVGLTPLLEATVAALRRINWMSPERLNSAVS